MPDEKESTTGVDMPNDKCGVHKLDELKEVFKDASKRTAIFIGVPDPDSIGSGLGMRELVRHLSGCESDLINIGEVSHPQNKTLVTALDVQLLHKADVLGTNGDLAERYDKFVFVDHIPEKNGVEPDVIIDHHGKTYDGTCFSDIRPAGSCCSLIYGLMRDAGIDFDDDEDGSKANTATAMVVGIQTDTHDFSSETTCSLDYDAHKFFATHADRSNLKKIIEFEYPKYFFDLRHELDKEENHKIIGSTFVGAVGVISPGKRDCLPMLADERVRMEGIQTAVVFAIIDDVLQVSIRTSSSNVGGVGAWAEKVFGKGLAGGRGGGFAGARVPLNVWGLKPLDDELASRAWKIYRDVVIARVHHVCAGN